jgi:threonine synthase
MRYYSLNHQAPEVDFKTATLLGQAPDKGLYFPQHIPTLSASWIQNLPNVSREAVAFDLIAPYVGDSIPETVLRKIVAETIDFPIPLVHLQDHLYTLELFHGPTLAFKDIGARFMSRCLQYFLSDQKEKVTVLVATSGDTGSAVAHGFHGIPGIEVIILYPSGKVSPLQEKQLTTLGDNIWALEVEGSFDDCQSLVKQAFADTDLQARKQLSSANSINIARWLPQQFYYAFALQQWKEKQAPVLCVPSGNFGNICAGILAKQSGLPIAHFIAACNANDVVTQYLSTGVLPSQAMQSTISNAMDVASPSNFVRLLTMMQESWPTMKQNVSSYRISDSETLQTIRTIFDTHQYILDPHGAVGVAAAKRYQQDNPNSSIIVLETAHPAKFTQVVEPCLDRTIALPLSVQDIVRKEKKSVLIPANYQLVKEAILMKR